MSMRVIAGTARRMKLEAPPGLDVRPAPEMGRAAIFNILQEEVKGAWVLDLFAGAGTIGIEALSRGAAKAVFVELSPRHKTFIDRNLAHTRLAERGEVLVRDAFRVPDQLKRLGYAFDIIYVGPPFPLWENPITKVQLMRLMGQLSEMGILKPTGTMIVQTDAKDFLPDSTPSLRRTDKRNYGRNVFYFYARVPRSSSPTVL